MNQLLRPGQEATTVKSKHNCRVERFLGAGGQGEVYQADIGGKKMALKWYYPGQDTHEQRLRLLYLVDEVPPDERFLWPVDLVANRRIPGFGYIMPLRDPGYKSLVDLMKKRIQPEPTFRIITEAGYQLSRSFLNLHSKGLAYRDISFSNVFFDPASGSVLICDNDNIGVTGKNEEATVLGTMRFMAPEIVAGRAAPSSDTDRFSLAVLLFYLLFVAHPLEGLKESRIRCLDMVAMRQIYGTDPVFIFDPLDDSNRPVPGIHDNAQLYWEIYPEFLRKKFVHSFTIGLKDPVNGRVRESEWCDVMISLQDSLMYCPQCGNENFYDPVALGAGKESLCWHCRQELDAPVRLRLKNRLVVINHDTVLLPRHLHPGQQDDANRIYARVVRNPHNPQLWGLNNLTTGNWMVTRADGTSAVVEPGKSVAISSGVRIDFGQITGVIEAG